MGKLHDRYTIYSLILIRMHNFQYFHTSFKWNVGAFKITSFEFFAGRIIY